MTTASDSKRLRIKIVLDNVLPMVWRRVEVNDDLTFYQLHRVIQQAMGWEDCHLHEFEVARLRVGTASAGDAMFMIRDVLIPERRTRLFELLDGRRKFRYWYDFGDDWWHTITIEKRLPPESGSPVVVLMEGENACPPEDCGGPWGYADLVAALARPGRPEYANAVDWLGMAFDPAAFDLDAHRKRVASVVRKTSKAKTAGEG